MGERGKEGLQVQRGVSGERRYCVTCCGPQGKGERGGGGLERRRRGHEGEEGGGGGVCVWRMIAGRFGACVFVRLCVFSCFGLCASSLLPFALFSALVIWSLLLLALFSYSLLFLFSLFIYLTHSKVITKNYIASGKKKMQRLRHRHTKS